MGHLLSTLMCTHPCFKNHQTLGCPHCNQCSGGDEGNMEDFEEFYVSCLHFDYVNDYVKLMTLWMAWTS
jgi:hypothetical protein